METVINVNDSGFEVDVSTDVALMLDMLSYRRPGGSNTEREYVERFILPLADLPHVEWMKRDRHDAVFMKIGQSPYLWSSHVDTVHRQEGRQQVYIDSEGIIFVSDDKSNALGADCSAGNWIMIEMIKAGVPGLYCFFAFEESGAISSREFGEIPPTWAADIKYAIAFDRKGTSSIITHQGCGKCCSDEFALAFGDAIGMGHVPDDTGVFTDTACLVDIIPECTNISIGYQSEHSISETLDSNYLIELRDKFISIDWGNLYLPVVRQCGDTGYTPKWGNPLSTWRNTDYLSSGYSDYSNGLDNLEWLLTASHREVTDHVRKSEPEDVADLLLELADQLAYRSEIYN